MQKLQIPAPPRKYSGLSRMRWAKDNANILFESKTFRGQRKSFFEILKIILTSYVDSPISKSFQQMLSYKSVFPYYFGFFFLKLAGNSQKKNHAKNLSFDLIGNYDLLNYKFTILHRSLVHQSIFEQSKLVIIFLTLRTV